MIGLRVNERWVDLGQNARVGIEVNNPLFDSRSINGTITYPMGIDFKSRVNRQILGFPDRLAAENPVSEFGNVQLYVLNTLYKTGVLKYRGQRDLVGSYNLQTDAGDFSNLVEGVKLRDLDLGTVARDVNVVNGSYPTYKYAFFPVLNPKFYGDKNANYGGYQNYYDGGFVANAAGVSVHNLTPFPYLVYLLETIFGLYGYRITGSWITDAEVRKITVHSNYAIDEIVGNVNSYSNNVVIANHVPDVTINAFLLAIRNKLALGFLFDSKLKEVKIVRLKDVLDTDEYQDWSKQATRDYNDTPVDYKGYMLRMEQDRTDDAMEQLGNDWLEYRIDGGAEEIFTNASSLHMFTGVDSLKPARTWTVPQVIQSGSSPEFDLGTNYHPIRLMYYQGLVNGYPNGTYVGDSIDLRWGGANGLYEQCHKPWLDFLKRGTMVDRKMNLNMVDLSKLDPEVPVLIDHLKFMWKRVSLTVSSEKLEVAKVTLVKM